VPEEKLSYSRGVLEKIRASYDKLSREELLDLICYISKTYIVEQTIPFDVPLPEKEEAPPDPEVMDAPPAAQASPAQRFATLIEGLKKRTQLPQLEHFSVEDGKAVLVVDNQKVTFGDRVTVEFVPLGRGGAAPARADAAPAPTSPRPTAPAPAPAPAEPPPPGARPGLPGGDGRVRQGGPKPPAPAPPPPPPSKKQPEAPPKKEGDLADVDHIVERFKRLDLD
jgi:hypothetical protein